MHRFLPIGCPRYYQPQFYSFYLFWSFCLFYLFWPFYAQDIINPLPNHQIASKFIQMHQNQWKSMQFHNHRSKSHAQFYPLDAINRNISHVVLSTYSHPCLHSGCLGDIFSPRQLASYGKGNKGGWGLHDEQSKSATGEESPLPKP